MPSRASIDLAAKATAESHKTRDSDFDRRERDPIAGLYWIAVTVLAVSLAPVLFYVLYLSPLHR